MMCDHYACRCARSAELAAMSDLAERRGDHPAAGRLLADAIAAHDRMVTCRLAESPAAASERVRRAYHDPSWPERNCDRCGQTYTGRAVYCSLDCALADAG